MIYTFALSLSLSQDIRRSLTLALPNPFYTPWLTPSPRLLLPCSLFQKPGTCMQNGATRLTVERYRLAGTNEVMSIPAGLGLLLWILGRGGVLPRSRLSGPECSGLSQGLRKYLYRPWIESLPREEDIQILRWQEDSASSSFLSSVLFFLFF